MPKKSSPSVRIFYPEYDTPALVEALKEKLPCLERELPLRKVVLFGSYARGGYTAASDIDLLVIYGGEHRRDAYSVCRKALDIRRLEPHLYTEDEYRAMKDTVSRMEEGGIILLDT